LLAYQQRWLADRSRVRVWAKSRRIGASWGGLACEAVLEAAAADGMDQWYIGYEQEMTREFILDCAHFSRVFGVATGEIGESVLQDDGESILAYSIKFASGYRITALSSRPRNLRSKQGHVIVDEAAFVDDLPGLLKAGIAMLVWGGKMSIVSSHNGVDNDFNQLVEDIRAGRKPYSLHVTTLDDAIADGLYERTCLARGETPTDAGREAWRQELIDFYGDDAAEELFCIPSKSGGAYINRALIESRMVDGGTVLRVECDDEFTLKPADYRRAWMDEWLIENVAALIEPLNLHLPTFYGQDFGRVSDLSVVAIGQLQQDLKLHVPWMIEMRNVPYEQQMQMLAWIVERLPRFGGGKVDGTGNGAALGEFAVQRFGATRFESVKISDKWYADTLPPFKAAFEDSRLTLPRDLDVLQDLAALRVIDGVPKMSKVRNASTKPKQGAKRAMRHGDAAIALVLCHAASRDQRVTEPVIYGLPTTVENDPTWGTYQRPTFGGL